MIIIELALQGLKNFPELVRMAMKPGVNVFRSSDRFARTAVVDAVYHTLFPDPSRGSATTHLIGTPGQVARIAVTFFGRDKITYRALRDADNGATKLFKFDQGQNKYALFTDASQEVAQYIRVQQRIPDEVGFERLFMFGPETMPSKGTGAKTRSGAPICTGLLDFAPSGPGMGAGGGAMGVGAPPRAMSGAGMQNPIGGAGALPRTGSGFGSSMNMTNALVRSELEGSGDVEPAAGDSLEEKKQQLIQLRRQFLEAQRAEGAQAELDQLSLRRFELIEKVERVDKIKAEHKRLVELRERDEDLKALPEGFATKLSRLEEQQRKYEQDSARFSQELLDLEAEEQAFHVVGLAQDKYFLFGVAVALLAIAAAIVLAQPALALLNVLAMVVAAGGAFRWVGDLEKKHRLGIRVSAARDRVDRMAREHRDDTRTTTELMQKLSVDSPVELLERVRGFEKLSDQIQVAEETYRRLMSDPEMASATRELDEINKRVEALESEVLGANTVVSADTLSRRIKSLEQELGPDAPPPEVVRTANPRNSSSSFFPPPASARQTSISGDIPGGPPPFTESGLTRAADPRAGSGPGRPVSSVPGVPAAPPVLSGRPVSAPGNRPPRHGSNRPGVQSSDRAGVVVGPPASRPEDDDEDDGYGSGYGYGRGRGGPTSGGGSAGASPYGSGNHGLYAVGFGGPPGALGGGGGFGGPHDDGGSGPAPDRSRDLMQIVVDLCSVEVDDLGGQIRKRLGQYLTAFTDKRYRDATFGPRGELTVVPAQGDPVPYVSLPPDQLDMVDAALRFTLIEYSVREVRVPVIFDDPFTGFSEKKRKLLGQMLGYLANTTQVVVLTDQPDLTGHALSL